MYDPSNGRGLNPMFQTPGSNITVNGAAALNRRCYPGRHVSPRNRVAVGLRFDGEFASRAQTYAGGTGTLRYAR